MIVIIIMYVYSLRVGELWFPTLLLIWLLGTYNPYTGSLAASRQNYSLPTPINFGLVQRAAGGYPARIPLFTRLITFRNMDLSRSESPIPTENTESRLAELEAKLASQEAKNTQVLDAQNTTLWLLAALTPTQSTAVPPTSLPLCDQN
jgi:hypothetical protein